jgi:hypothetical protein
MQTHHTLSYDFYLHDSLALTGGLAFLLYSMIRFLSFSFTQQNLLRRLMQKIYLQDIESIINKNSNTLDIETDTATIYGDSVTNWYMGYFKKLRAVSYGSAFHCIRKVKRMIGVKAKEPQSVIVERGSVKLEG